jgi:ribosomal protein S18 acetylase RimI-like enzyme
MLKHNVEGVECKNEGGLIEVIPYQKIHQPLFEKFNRSWIEAYFEMEPIDFQVLQAPEEHILRKGGFIWMARYNNEIVGTVALKLVEDGIYEFSKMAVDERFRGKGIGNALAEVAITHAKMKKAKQILLYSETSLKAAIALYKKLGFQEIHNDGRYKRSDIKMALNLDYNT